MSSTVGLFGFQKTLEGPFAQIALNAGIAGSAVLTFAAVLILTSRPRAAGLHVPASGTASAAVTAADDQPGPRNVPQPVKWSTERSQQPVPSAPQPPLQAPTAEVVPAETPGPADQSFGQRLRWSAGSAAEQPAPAPEPAVTEGSQPALASVAEHAPEPVRSLLFREQQVLSSLERNMGSDHPSTLTSRTNIAYYYVAAGQVPEATILQEQVLEDSARILGERHPHTLTARKKLDAWRKLAKAG